jgi:hypothetical protein
VRMKTIGVTLALVVTLGLAGAGSASASQSALTDAALASSAPARAAVACSTARVPADYYEQGRFAEPNECAKCQDAGAYWERKGGYKAFCKRATDISGIRWAVLYIFCQKCREGAPGAESMTRTDQDETTPSAGGAGA